MFHISWNFVCLYRLKRLKM